MPQQGGDKEDGPDQGEHVGERDVGEENLQKAIKQCVISDIVGIKTHLNQNLRNPQVVGRRIEDAIERRRHVYMAGVHSSSPRAFGEAVSYTTPVTAAPNLLVLPFCGEENRLPVHPDSLYGSLM